MIGFRAIAERSGAGDENSGSKEERPPERMVVELKDKLEAVVIEVERPRRVRRPAWRPMWFRRS